MLNMVIIIGMFVTYAESPLKVSATCVIYVILIHALPAMTYLNLTIPKLTLLENL